MRPVRFGLCAAAWFVGTLAAAPAAADDAACLQAATQGQRLRDTHKLVEAREKLRVCASAQCPPVVQADCAGWLASVEKALPSVVVTASDEAGASWIDVKVTVDGQPFATRLDGQAVPIDPGPHTFRFQAPDGSTVERVDVIPEGEQNHGLHVVLARKPSSSPARAAVPEAAPVALAPPIAEPPPSGPETAQPSPPGQLSPPAQPQAPGQPSSAGQPQAPATAANAGSSISGDSAGMAEHGASPAAAGGPWKAVGWVAAGLGAAGLAVGTVFGVMAIEDHGSAQCNASRRCLTGPLDDARGAATVSTAGFIAGGVLAAAGLGVVIFAPSSARGEGQERDTGATVTRAPVVSLVLAPSGAGLGVGGTW